MADRALSRRRHTPEQRDLVLARAAVDVECPVVDELEPVSVGEIEELARLDRLVDDLEEVRPARAEPAKVHRVRGAHEHAAACGQSPRDAPEEPLPLGRRDVLEDVEEGHEIELPRERHRVERAGVERRRRDELARELDRGLAEVDPCHAAEARQVAREDAGAAADVEDAKVPRAVQELVHDQLELLVPRVRREPVAEPDVEGEPLIVLGGPRTRGQDGTEASAGSGEPRRRVAVVTEWYPRPEHPFLGTFVADHARALASRHDVAVVVVSRARVTGVRPWEVEDAEELGIRTLRVRHRGRFAFRVAATLAALRRIDPAPDVLHAHVFGPGLVALAAARRRRIPVVVSEHESRVARGRLSRAERAVARLVYRRADAICPVSEDLGGPIVELAPAARLRPLPNPVDTALFRPSAPPEGPPLRALLVAGLVPVKAVRDVLQALALLRDRGRDVVLEIVGDGPEREALEERAWELGLADHVGFRGALEREAVAAAMQAAHVVCLASRWENLPVAAIEALASGRPVVAPRVGGVPEVVGPEDGVLFPAGDVPALARSLAEVDERLQDFDPEALASRAAARFGFEAVAARASEIYEDVLAARERP